MPRLLYVVTEDWYFLSHRLPMARAARDAGFDVHVATRVGEGREAIEAEGFTLHALSWCRGSLSLFDSLSSIAGLRHLFHSLKPDLVHNVAVKPVLLSSSASLGLNRIAIVNSLTGLGSSLISEGLIWRAVRSAVGFWLARLLRRDRSCTVVQNPDDLAYVAALGVPEDKIVLIPGSGVDTGELTPLPEPRVPVTMAFVGRMLADKGVPLIVEAFKRAARRGISLELLLAGRCDEENPRSLTPQQLRDLASGEGIEWLGHVADIRKVWSRAHFAVHGSRGGEGLPKSLLEAAACGRPMVTTDAPGCREIAVAGKTALTVPIGDVAALADAMTQMALDGDLRRKFGANARALVEASFSAEAIGEQTVAVYEALLRGLTPPSSS